MKRRFYFRDWLEFNPKLDRKPLPLLSKMTPMEKSCAALAAQVVGGVPGAHSVILAEKDVLFANCLCGVQLCRLQRLHTKSFSVAYIQKTGETCFIYGVAPISCINILASLKGALNFWIVRDVAVGTICHPKSHGPELHAAMCEVFPNPGL